MRLAIAERLTNVRPPIGGGTKDGGPNSEIVIILSFVLSDSIGQSQTAASHSLRWMPHICPRLLQPMPLGRRRRLLNQKCFRTSQKEGICILRAVSSSWPARDSYMDGRPSCASSSVLLLLTEPMKDHVPIDICVLASATREEKEKGSI